MMSRKTFGCGLALAALAVMGARVQAQTWWNPDYTQRIGLTIQNNAAVATPTPSSAEFTYASGAKEQTGAGTTAYASLPTGLRLSFSANGTSLDDNTTVVTLPFSFPFNGTTSSQIVVGIDGYMCPGGTDLGRPDKVADAQTRAEIIPWSSDFAITDTENTGVFADLQPTQATFRWEVQESSSSILPVIAKFAAILKPDGSIRFVYGTPCGSPSAGIADPANTPTAGYAPIKYGVGAGLPANIHAPAYPADFSGHADVLFNYLPPPTWRKDNADIRVQHWTGSAWEELDRQILNDSASVTRIVFRLKNSIPAGGSSTGEYYIYFNNTSPVLDAPNNTYNIYDYVEDFSSAANVVGQPAPDWVSSTPKDSMTVISVNGVKHGQMTTTGDHTKFVVKSSAMPSFLNAELYARFFPTGGENECAPMIRAVGDPANGYSDPNFAYTGGYGYVIDGFGSQQGLVSYVNSSINTGPGIVSVSGTYHGENGVYENVILRATDTLAGKAWKDRDAQPYWFLSGVALNAGAPSHGTPDPQWTLPGTVGMGSYSTNPTILFMAIREIRNLGYTPAAAEVGPAGGPYIQGVISSTYFGPLANLTFTITGNSKTYNMITGPNGEYKITLPAGTYTVSASKYGHTTTTVTNVSPTASGITNLVLPYVGFHINGIGTVALTGQREAGATIVLLDSNGFNVQQTVADSKGRYALETPTAGTFNVSMMGTDGNGGRTAITGTSGSTVTANVAGTLISNGDAETPDPSNTNPLQWSAAFDTPTAYLYSRDQNHTPGGHWSVAILDPSTPPQGNSLSCWNPPPSGFFNLPILSDVMDVQVSLWVYFTKTTQRARLRLRNNWVPSGVFAVCGQGPDPNNKNTGGLDGNGKVPLGQWYEIRSVVPAGTITFSPAQTTEVDAYAYNGVYTGSPSPTNGGNDGTVYFDDFTITLTPKSSALGKVVDGSGNPISGAYVGQMTFAGGLEGQNLLTSPFFFSDDSGNFRLFQAADGPVTVGAWAAPTPGATGYLPNYGNLLGTATLNTVASPTTRTTITVPKTSVVSIGAAVNAGGKNDATAVRTDDNSLFTRWDSGTAGDVTLTYDLGASKSIDQVELFWELATPDAYTLEIDPNIGDANVVQSVAADGATLGITGSGFSGGAFSEGPYHIIRLPSPVSGRYIKVHMTANTSPYTNFSLIEMRALSAGAALPVLTRADAAKALQIAGGLLTAAPADLFKLDTNGDGKITAADAVAIAKIAP